MFKTTNQEILDTNVSEKNQPPPRREHHAAESRSCLTQLLKVDAPLNNNWLVVSTYAKNTHTFILLNWDHNLKMNMYVYTYKHHLYLSWIDVLSIVYDFPPTNHCKETHVITLPSSTPTSPIFKADFPTLFRNNEGVSKYTSFLITKLGNILGNILVSVFPNMYVS